MALAVMAVCGFALPVIAEPGPKAEPKGEKTIAVYLRAVPSGLHQTVLDGLEANSPGYDFVAVRVPRQMFDYVGFIVAEVATENHYYYLEPSPRRRMRVVGVPVANFLKLSAFADWPTTWGKIQTVSALLDVPEDTRLRIFDDEPLKGTGINDLTAVLREEIKNNKELGAQLKAGIAKLPMFGPAEKKK